MILVVDTNYIVRLNAKLKAGKPLAEVADPQFYKVLQSILLPRDVHFKGNTDDVDAYKKFKRFIDVFVSDLVMGKPVDLQKILYVGSFKSAGGVISSQLFVSHENLYKSPQISKVFTDEDMGF